MRSAFVGRAFTTTQLRSRCSTVVAVHVLRDRLHCCRFIYISFMQKMQKIIIFPCQCERSQIDGRSAYVCASAWNVGLITPNAQTLFCVCATKRFSALSLGSLFAFREMGNYVKLLHK